MVERKEQKEQEQARQMIVHFCMCVLSNTRRILCSDGCEEEKNVEAGNMPCVVLLNSPRLAVVLVRLVWLVVEVHRRRNHHPSSVHDTMNICGHLAVLFGLSFIKFSSIGMMRQNPAQN